MLHYMSLTYQSAEPCKNGHTGPRRASTRQCIECHREYIRERRKNPEKLQRERDVENARRRLIAERDGWASEGQRRRQQRYDRKRRGIPTPTRPEPENCENCSRKLEPGFRTHADHDHVTGKFRGWLCNKCNLGLGCLGDSIEAIERTLGYLRRAL